MALTKTEVSKLYVSIFNRASEGAGNTYWQEDAADLKDAAAKMLSTPDAATYFGTSLDSNQAFIEHIYLNTLNKTASQDAEGIAYWVNQLNSGLSRAEIVGSLVTAVDDYAASTDPVTAFAYHQVTNRVAVSDSIADSGITDMAFTQKALAAVSADMSTLDIVENLVAMVQDNPTALTEVSNTLVEVKELIAANASNATASAAVFANLATVIENVAASSTSGTISNLSSTLSALTATVEAAKTDAAFIANPQTLASSIATNPTVVTQSANTTVTTGTAVEVPTTPTTPSTGGGGGGSSTPAPTFTASVDENGTITFSGTATGNITMNGGDSSEGDTQDVTFTRGGVTTSTVTLGGNSKISLASGQTYVITAAQANEAVIEGEGTVNITNLEDTLDADLSGITATNVTATVTTITGTPVDFTGDFGEATVTISGDGFLRVDNATIGTATFIVGADSILQGTSTVLSGVTTSGAGYVTIMPLATDTDATNLTASDVAAVVSATVDISTNTNLSSIDRYSVSNEQTLTLTAAQAVSKSISGAGSVTVKDLAADTDLSTITASGTLSATVTSTVDLTSANLTGLDALSVTDGADTAIAVTVTPEQYAALVGKVTLGANDTLVSTDTTIPTSTITSAAFDENTGTLTITGTNFDTILETTEDAATDVKARLDWSKLSWDINGDDGSTANVSFEVGDISSVKVTDATTLTITLTNTKTAALIATTGYNETSSSAVDTLDVLEGFIRDMSHNAATTDAAANGAITITADNTAPTIASVTVADGTYKIGDAVAVTVTAGSSETGLTLAGTFNGQTLSAITDNGDGTYTGTYTVVSGDTDVADEESVTTSITLTDAASNASEATTSVTLVGESIDAHAPTTPTIELSDDVGSVTGTLSNGAVTDDVSVLVRVTLSDTGAVADDIVRLYTGTTMLATAGSMSADTAITSTDISNGYVNVTTSDLVNGATYALNAKIVDQAGNASLASSSTSVTVDTTAPSVTLTYSTDGGSTYSSTIDTKNADTLKIKATFSEAIDDTAGATIAIDNSVLNTTAMTKTSTTEYYYDLDVPSGDIAAASVTVGAAKDAAGNTISAAPTNPTFAIDNTATTTTISAIDISTDTGTSDTDFITKTASQTITATLSAELIAGDIVYGSVNNGSTWTNITDKVSGTTISWDEATLSGESSIALKVSDAAGNDGTPATQAYTLDTTAPAIIVAHAVASATTISLTANENAVAGIYTVESALIGSAVSLTADQSGSITVAAQDTVTAGVIVVTDVAGNSTTSTSIVLGTTGEDYLLCDENANIIFGFNGNNTFNSGAGNYILYGGSNQDSFQFTSENFNAGKTINGGGTDAPNSIYITDAATIIDEDFTNVTDVGQIDLTGGLTHSIILGTNASSAFTYTGATNKLGIGIMNGETATSLTVDASNVTIGITVDNKPSSGNAGTTEVTGGSGDDMFIFGATGASTVHFADTAANNGEDKIYVTDATDSLTLNFSNFITVNANTTAVDFVTAGLDLTTNNLGIVFNKAALSSDDIATSAATSKIAVSDNGKAVVFCANVTDANTDDTSWNIYYIEDTNNNGGSQTWEVTLVGQVYADGTGATATEIAAITFA